ncbi:MAG: RecT family recombinase [Alphaproteobacteria bacterium]
MSNEIVKATTAEVSTVTEQELIGHLENLGLVNKLTAGEKSTFIAIAKAFNLNPFKREIHVSKYGDKASIITGYEVYIKRAERTGLLDGWECVTTGSVAQGNLKATLTIYRKDRNRPFIWEADYNEFVQKTSSGSVTQFWQKASFMIKKVAISQGFRLCFSDELGGMPYTKEEMPEQSTEDIPYTPVETPQSQIAAKKKLTEAKYQQALSGVKNGATLPNSDVSFFTFLTTECELTTEQLIEVNAAYPL